MAEETTGNGADGGPAASPADTQQLILNAQYIKDLSFENPRAPQSLIQPTNLMSKLISMLRRKTSARMSLRSC